MINSEHKPVPTMSTVHSTTERAETLITTTAIIFEPDSDTGAAATDMNGRNAVEDGMACVPVSPKNYNRVVNLIVDTATHTN